MNTTLYEIEDKLAQKRSVRRTVGWFDYSSMSFDRETTMLRAERIFARLNGERRPLLNVHGRPVPWNSYHH